MKPHKVRYWLNPEIEDEAAWLAQAEEVCALYRDAGQLLEVGVHVVSCDEKTGMQALERMAPSRPAQPGKPLAMEFWYRRHGTCCLTANLEVATGKVIAPTLAKTRGNLDFLHHICRTVDTDPGGSWVFIVDNLSSHKSAELVRYVAAACDISDCLGRKGKTGILKNKASRQAFLSDPSHRIRFVYTPKHCSWLNAIESWFGQLARRLLKRASCVSVPDLMDKVRRFIHWHNLQRAKPLEWTWKAKLPERIRQAEQPH